MEGWWVASYVVLWLVVVALGAVVVALARQVGTLHLRLGPRGALELDDEGPPLGEPAEPYETTTIDGRPVSVGGPGPPRLVMFVSPGCRVCAQVLPSLAAIAPDLEALVVSDADVHETRVGLAAKNVAAPVVASPDIARSYDVPGTPYVVVLDDLGIVRGKGTVNNLEQLEGLVDTARARIRGIGPHARATPDQTPESVGG